MKVGIIIIHPWNYHWCMTACQRVSAMAPRWNRALQCARELGIQVIWAPTEAASQNAGTPQRERAAAVNLVPVPQVRRLSCAFTTAVGACMCGPGIPCEINYGLDGICSDLVIDAADLIVSGTQETHSICKQKGRSILMPITPRPKPTSDSATGSSASASTGNNRKPTTANNHATQLMKTITRRQFITTSSQATAAIGAGSAVLGFPAIAGAQSPADQLVLALIGAGGRASSLSAGMSRLPGVEFKYVCDIWKDRGAGIMQDLEKVQKRAPQRITDLRAALDDKEVNAVVIATPEHWHALATVWACQAGKDVYVEKNPSIAIWEGRKMIEAARKYQRIVQVGFQNRSGPYAASARDYIANGKLGRIVHVKVYNMLDGSKWEPKPDSPPPAGLDWDAWLGPAPEVPYNPGRHLNWHPWWDYKGGTLADDASHQLDLTRMALGDPPHPKSVLCIGGNYAFQSQREVPEFQCITYDYGDFAMTCESGNATSYLRKFPGEVRYGDQWPHWPTSATRVEIYGTKALMYLGRHGCGWQVVVEGGKVIDQDKGHFPDKWHQPNFIDCLRTRKQPNGDIEQAHHSACLVHLGNTSYRVGQKQLMFDGATERFTNNDAANALLKPAYRKHYRIPEQV